MSTPNFTKFEKICVTTSKNQNLWNFYNCKLCSYRTKSFFIMRSHIRRHSFTQHFKPFSCIKAYIERYKCSICPLRTAFLVNIKKHISGGHAKSKRNKESVAVQECYVCDVCQFETCSQLVYVRHTHTNQRHIVKKSKCALCPFETTKHFLLKNHIMQTHIADTRGPQRPHFMCNVCGYGTPEYAELEEHILARHVTTETVICFKCGLCGFKTIKEEELRGHVLGEHVDPQNRNWLRCDICDAKYRTVQELRGHIMEKHFI